MAGETILIVDDNEVNLKLLRVVLAGGGFDVRTAGDAKAAQAIIDAVHPPLVLMDVQLPDMDGLELTRRIKQNPATADIRVLAVTAYAMKGDDEKARAAGCDGYLTKPIDTRSLIGVVNSALQTPAPARSAPPPPAAASGNGHAPLAPVVGNDAALILVVEDDPHMNRFLATTLSRRFRVATAHDGVEGLALAKEVRPDLIMTDMMMPKMFGDELLARLRADPSFDDTPVVVLTGQAEDDLRLRLLRSGAQDYLAKPCSAEEIEARVGNLVRMKRVRDLLRAELEEQRGDVESLARELMQRKRELQTVVDSLRVAREHAERASEMKSDFLRMVSHELRTPVTSLELNLTSLERSRSWTDGEHQLMHRIARAAKRLTGLVEALLEYSRVRSAQVSVDIRAIDLHALCEEIIDEISAQAEEKGLSVQLHAPAELPPLRSDARIVHLVVVNLLQNAVKFTERGAIDITLTHDAGIHRVEVRDTGVGIAAQDQARIFQPFVHLEPTAGKHTPGAGLGLALVKDFLAGLGGEIRVASEPAQGSTFTVIIPSLADDAARGGAVRPGSPAPSPSRPPVN